jgi:hypothetical protein
MQMLFWRKIFEDGHCLSPGLFAAPYLKLPEVSFISYIKPMENILPLNPELGQGKLTTLRCENRQIRHHPNLKSNRTALSGVGISDLSNGTQNHT